MVILKTNEIKVNPSNPRIIKDFNFKRLVQSVIDFPEMLNLRPIVVNKDMVILGGNMRFKACIEAGIKEVPVIIADNLTPEQENEFLIKDNVSGGEWDWDILANEWNSEELLEWGLDLPIYIDNDVDYSGKNKEIDVDLYENEMIIKLKYSEDDYNLVRDQLSKIASTPEQAVYKLLGNE
jgi:hypothetical protein